MHSYRQLGKLGSFSIYICVTDISIMAVVRREKKKEKYTFILYY